jgi:hypothetical protein
MYELRIDASAPGRKRTPVVNDVETQAEKELGNLIAQFDNGTFEEKSLK